MLLARMERERARVVKVHPEALLVPERLNRQTKLTLKRT
jgi:hypothetical protein